MKSTIKEDEGEIKKEEDEEITRKEVYDKYTSGKMRDKNITDVLNKKPNLKNFANFNRI